MAQTRDVTRRLKEIINGAGRSVSALEADLGKSRNYIHDALAGRKRITVDLIVECLQGLGLPLESLFVMSDDCVAEPTIPYDEEIYRERKRQYPEAPDDLVKRLTKAEQDLDEATVRVARSLRQLNLFDKKE